MSIAGVDVAEDARRDDRAPSRSPPVSSVAPPATASRIACSTRIASTSEITGPSPVCSSRGWPVRSSSTSGVSALDEVAVDLAGDEHALDRDAHLAGVDVAARRGRRGDLVEVGVGEDDQRAVRAELEREALDPGDAGDLLSDRRRSGEADLAHARIGAQHAAELGARARHALDRVLRQPRLEEHAREEQRRQRRLPGRLQHDGVAGRQRRADLVHDEQRGVVERRDGDDDAARLADREARACRRRSPPSRPAPSRRASGRLPAALVRRSAGIRAASPRASTSGLPTSSAIVRASSSLASASASAARRSISDRSKAESARIAAGSVDGCRERQLGVAGVRDGDDADDLSVVRIPDLLLPRCAPPLARDVHRHASAPPSTARRRDRVVGCRARRA